MTRVSKNASYSFMSEKLFDMSRASEALAVYLRPLYEQTTFIFEFCTAKHLILPNGLREIGERCFVATHILKITVPSSV